MPYSYGEENIRPYTRASAPRREPGPSVPIPVPQQRKRRELPSPVPVPQQRVRRQKNPSKRIRLHMVLGIGLIIFSLLVILHGVLVSNQFPRLQFLPPSQINQTNQGSSLPLLFPVQKISRSVTAFSQADKTQYNNENPQWSQWSYSACSGCAMAALMDAYGANLNGKPLNCGDVLEVEYRLSVYNPVHAWGLQRGVPDELAKTAAQFGFTGYSTQKLSLDDLITLANAGIPSIVRIPSHIMILTGGDSQHIFLADSGGLHLSQVDRTQFLHGLPGSKLYAGQSWMEGWYIILTPNKQNT
jgi:hypothetical protein